MKPGVHEMLLAAAAQKMRAEGLSDLAIRSFESNYRRFWSNTGTIRESAIIPLEPKDLTLFKNLRQSGVHGRAILSKAAILKLNGGLGTTMGLEGPKSLLKVKDGLTFLDIIVRQTLLLREEAKAQVRLIFMNSFNTSAETTTWLQKHYPALAAEPDIELLQNKIPKIHEKDQSPIEYPADRELEWCPPGHGDIYIALQQSGLIQRLLDASVRYLFVSNADNLGATLDPRLLSHFAASHAPFLMEVAERTEHDQKGGHLAKTKAGRLVLRESVQCHDEDKEHFQDVKRHRYFNTNNLWIKLDRLKDLMETFGGLMPLPVIRNLKRVDPTDSNSAFVSQYETAMGAAIELFEGAAAIVVSRTRFTPVKTHTDLERLRSDAYKLTEDFRIIRKS
jgi:UDP-N-acetylglucosamine pyrophosphorylase